MQDIEFTIDDGRLWILQARAAKRTARAALKIAVDFVHEGLCTPEEALQRLSALAAHRAAIGGVPFLKGIGSRWAATRARSFSARSRS